MARVIKAKVAPRGVLIPPPLLAMWGEIEEVEWEGGIL